MSKLIAALAATLIAATASMSAFAAPAPVHHGTKAHAQASHKHMTHKHVTHKQVAHKQAKHHQHAAHAQKHATAHKRTHVG